MASLIDIGTLITLTPGILGGRPHIARTGVTVRRIAVLSRLGCTPEEIVQEIGHLSLAQVYGALACYHINREAIDADLAAEEADTDELEARPVAPHRGRESLSP